MRIAITLLIMALVAVPSVSVAASQPAPFMVAAHAKDKKAKPVGGKVVIKGKGGKVTDVQKKPRPKK